ncbi:tRNA lysidine(34) synthetase TilS [Caldalkalibacillus thermarum]|uniref:tRNA lysidine(34) synthetase TilS n=1 Tax=Caldalkalibacillus thermarum TaxID=296745 RepID=UPI00166A27F4|nr:tRNA lysidine(34) synthetase TilS [Caldalkalibacillus thermarum]
MELKQIDEKVLTTIREHNLLACGDRILVAVSGGPDSMMLLHWLWRFQARWDLELVAVHLNHQLRGHEADLDQAYVEEMCARWNISCVSKKRDVASYARKHRLSKQVAARECRYALFKEVALSQKCDKVAVAHHADDQVETVLMRLIRGTGLQGLSGMRPKRRLAEFGPLAACELIRPLLALTKDEIEYYCQIYELHPRLDRSNLADDATRNWIRHHLVPKMKALNPNLPQVIQEMTHLVADDEAYLTQLAEEKLVHIVDERSEQQIRVRLPALRQLPPPLQRRVILLLLSYLSHVRQWKKAHIDSVLGVIKREEGHQQLHLPAEIDVERQYDVLFLRKRTLSGSDAQISFCYELSGPGTYQWEGLPFCLTIDKRPVSAQRPEKGSGRQKDQRGLQRAYFDAEELNFPLLVRNRRPGDKIQPLGMTGHRKVKDIFIDCKIPQHQRDLWPIILDQEGVIWIPGLKRSDRAKVTDKTKEMYVLTMNMKEGFGC